MNVESSRFKVKVLNDLYTIRKKLLKPRKVESQKKQNDFNFLNNFMWSTWSNELEKSA